jgi:hypothetical protein
VQTLLVLHLEISLAQLLDFLVDLDFRIDVNLFLEMPKFPVSNAHNTVLINDNRYFNLLFNISTGR